MALKGKINLEHNLYLDGERYKDLLQTCQFCMKMCRFACPVAETTKSEMLTPWGKVSAVGQHAGTVDNWALTSFECNHCGLCTAHCKHENPVEALLTKQRAVIPDKFLTPEMNRVKEQLAKAYTAIKPLPKPAGTRKILYWPCMGLDKIDRLKKGKMPDDFDNPFIKKAVAILESRYPAGTVEVATVQDLGFDLYSAGLEEAFLTHADFVRQEIDGFELVVFESSVDLYVIDHILDRYGRFQGTDYTSIWNWCAENLGEKLKAAGSDPHWVLWADGFSARHLGETTLEAVEMLSGKLQSTQPKWLVPEGKHRPNLWSEGFIPYCDAERIPVLAGPALDVLQDYKGTLVLTSVRDYQFARKHTANKCVYLLDLIYDGL